MTSKEFIENLKSNGIYYCKECNLKGCDNCEKERNAQFDSVIKDLEILEMLKKIPFYIDSFTGTCRNNYWYIKTKENTRISEEEKEKFREWLENGIIDK